MLSRDDIEGRIGEVLGTSNWIDISQARIDAFAELTEDRQPIHLDPEVGKTAGMGGTVAHGFLTLSMLSAMSYQVFPKMAGETASLNYGFDRIRFVTPVPGETRIRGHFTLSGAEPRGDGLMLRFAVHVEIEGQEKPALTADWLCVYLF